MKTKINTPQEESKNTEKKCFVIMPISQQSGYSTDHFTKVYEDIIKPAILKLNMAPIRADETANTNLIHLDILRKVIESDIAICDMSAKNPNVFYELGIRHAFDKPTVLMIDDETDAPFDISSLRYVNYKKNMGYRDVNIAIDKLTKALNETYNKKDDVDEVNSLIRLLEITTLPAKLSQSNTTSEDRVAMQIAELRHSIVMMQSAQERFFDGVNKQGFSSDNIERELISKRKIDLRLDRIKIREMEVREMEERQRKMLLEAINNPKTGIEY